ncbi:MAG: dihydroorotate dehydrogenase electron transfer subunit [Smithellaceae bacterium]|nr:dihydroorotate dehydrogenase electron transfer subunit [Smithellaceae bacterium]
MYGNIIENKKTVAGDFILSIGLSAKFPRPAPGQFVMVRPHNAIEPLLSRPFSIYDYERGRAGVRLRLLFRKVGRGTSVLSEMKAGDQLDLSGPLGRGFVVPPRTRRAILVAGGMGMAPLAFLAKTIRKGLAVEFYLGVKSEEQLVEKEELGLICPEFWISTDDGSCGYCGIITDLLSQRVSYAELKDTVIFACGPRPMLRDLYRRIKGSFVPCQVSVEEKMACGMGACLGCAIAVRAGTDGLSYKRVCKDGPVFDIREILWEE